MGSCAFLSLHPMPYGGQDTELALIQSLSPTLSWQSLTDDPLSYLCQYRQETEAQGRLSFAGPELGGTAQGFHLAALVGL